MWIARRKSLYTKQQYHRWKIFKNYKGIDALNTHCDLYSAAGYPLESFTEESFGIISEGDTVVELPTRLLCGNCFSVRNDKSRVSANAGRVS